MLPAKKSDYITVGRIGHTYGVKGFVKIRLAESSQSLKALQVFLDYQHWFIFSRGKKIPLINCQIKGNFLISQIENCPSPEEAKQYANFPIMVLRGQLAVLSPDEFYWADLIGLAVYTLDNLYLGQIDSLFETGANDVMVIKSPENSQEILIPYVMNIIIKKINLETKTMQVDWEKEWL